MGSSSSITNNHQRLVADCAVSQRKTSPDPCRGSFTRRHRFTTYHIRHVYEGHHLRRWCRVFRRPAHLARSRLAKQNLPELAEIIGDPKVSPEM